MNEQDQADLEGMLDQRDREQRLETDLYSNEKVDARWLYDYDLLFLQFEANMRGGKLKRNSLTQQYEIIVPKGAEPFMNDHGIKDILALYRANVSIITGSSIMMEDRVLMWCERIQMDLADLLYINMKKYDLDPGKFSIVISTFMSNYEANLRKSIGGKGLIYSMQTERRMIHEDATPHAPSGLLGRLLGTR